ncbi:MAG: tRNA lysidine(34) synthetase TilS [Gemmatimonadota bacterium]
MNGLPSSSLQDAFRGQFSGPEWEGGRIRILVALSGGLDSLVLLHLLRFLPDLPDFHLEAAHFDHRMREGSGRDALWVKGLCRAWSVSLHPGRAEVPLSSEEEARTARYAFLLRMKAALETSWLLTAHHADDQAETVLFRVFRGTGLAGLAGIPAVTSSGIFRPLLPFSRKALEEYAREAGIRPREDPSNADLTVPRNRIRHSILPQVEEGVAPGARSSLQRLARLARENEAAWDSILPGLVERLVQEESRGTFIVRSSFLEYHPAVQARLLRMLLRRTGLILDEAGTRRVLEFTRIGASGRALDLPGGIRIRREFDRFCLEESSGDTAEDLPLTLHGPEPGSGKAVVGGRALEVHWGVQEVKGTHDRVRLSLPELEFPLRIRGWFPGDRISLPYGTKKLKKLLAEAGVPVGARKSVPVLADARGRILWVAGLTASVLAGFRGQGTLFSLGIRYEDEF